MFGLKRRRRRLLRATPLPDASWAMIDRNVPYVRLLDTDERRELGGHIQVFLAEKRFEGCGGLSVTDEIRLTIAAQACILLLGRTEACYPGLRSILVYPAAYVAPHRQHLPDGTVIEGAQARLGESWVRGSVVLSWDDVRRGAADIADGRNVVFHEFAHQLDSQSGSNQGDPVLERRSMYIAWARVLGGEYERLIEQVRRGQTTLISSYGATSPAEFFAVITEAFFEQPLALRDQHPELYEQLRAFYRQDPAQRRMSGS